MEKVFVLTLEHISENDNDFKVLGAFGSLSEAELAKADIREQVTKTIEEVYDEDEIEVYDISGTNQTCVAALYDFDNYYINITECKLGEIIKFGN